MTEGIFKSCSGAGQEGVSDQARLLMTTEGRGRGADTWVPLITQMHYVTDRADSLGKVPLFVTAHSVFVHILPEGYTSGSHTKYDHIPE